MEEPIQTKPVRWQGSCLWPILGGITGIFAVGLLFLVASLSRTLRMREMPTPVITLLPFQASATAAPKETSIGFETTPTSTRASPDSRGGDFIIGDMVEVYGTGGEGLRLRNAPNLSAAVNELAMENEVYEIRGGPIEADGYIWWFLVNPYENQRQGWSVGTYVRELLP